MTTLGLARRARRRQPCCVSWLRFAECEGLEDADPMADLRDALEEEGIAQGAHCPRVIERSPRVTLCHEDAELTRNSIAYTLSPLSTTLSTSGTSSPCSSVICSTISRSEVGS